jgi:hypothetical protein
VTVIQVHHRWGYPDDAADFIVVADAVIIGHNLIPNPEIGQGAGVCFGVRHYTLLS